VDQAVGGHAITSVNVGGTSPVAELSPGLANDDCNGSGVPGIEQWIGHHLRSASGHKEVPVGITPCPYDAAGLFKIKANLAPCPGRVEPGRAAAKVTEVT